MRYVFADCLLDSQLYMLYRAGLAIPLRPKAFHVLRYLLEQRDHLVSKEELCAHVWPAQFISDATIEGCIKRARQAIGDTGSAQQLIQTRRGYGYRFVGVVEELPAASPAQVPTVPLRRAPAAPTQDDPHGRPDLVRLPGEDAVASGAGAVSSALHSSLAPRTALADTVQGGPGGERKLVTLLGCSLAQAATLQAHQMRTLYTLAQEEVRCYGGTIHHMAGTRLLAIFGAPVAHEDHARRAVRLEEVASMLVPGQPTPVRTYQIMGLHAPDISGTQGELQARSPFVGRAHELATLHAVLAHVVGGRGQSVGIVAEPGIGKSRLLVEWRQQLQARGGVAYLEGHCLSYGSTTPYLPVLDWLRAHCGITPADGGDTITAKVCGSLQAVGLAPDAGAPVLLHLLGGEAATARVANISPDTLKAHTFATLRQLWLTSSQRHPLILAVEDLHWSDPTSEEFVASLVEGLPGAALLVLGTYRP